MDKRLTVRCLFADDHETVIRALLYYDDGLLYLGRLARRPAGKANREEGLQVMSKLKTMLVSATSGNWTAGDKLERPEHIAAYIRECFAAVQEEGKEAPELSTDEIIRAYNAVTNDPENKDADAAAIEDAVVSFLEDYVSGQHTGEGEEPNLSSISAENRRAVAHTLGAKLLGTGFDDHLAEYLAANLTVKKGPVVAMDDLVGRKAFTSTVSHVYVNSISDNQEVPHGYTVGEVLLFPRPGSKALKGVEVSDADMMKYDNYKTSISGETVRSSWVKDMILATTTAAQLSERIASLAEGAKNDGHILSDKKTDETQLNSAVAVVRKAILAVWALDALKAFPLLRVEVQREDDGAPCKTQYPVMIYQEGKRGSMLPVTLGQLTHMTDIADGQAKTGFTRLDMALAAGGTIDNLKTFAMPKKKKGAGKNKIEVADAEKAFTAIFAVANYVTTAGATPMLAKLRLKSEVGESYLWAFEQAMSVLAPIYEQEDIQAAIAVLKDKQAKAEAKAKPQVAKAAAASLAFQAAKKTA